jgi:hypothetical protein
MKDDAGDYYGDGSDGVNAGIVFLPDKGKDATDGIAKAADPVAEGEFFRVYHRLLFRACRLR